MIVPHICSIYGTFEFFVAQLFSFELTIDFGFFNVHICYYSRHICIQIDYIWAVKPTVYIIWLIHFHLSLHFKNVIEVREKSCHCYHATCRPKSQRLEFYDDGYWFESFGGLDYGRALRQSVLF